MCKKLIYLIPFALMLGSVGNAEDIQWTDLGADHLWSTPENWDLGRVPTLADEVRIDVPAAAALNGPVIQDGIDAKAKGIFTEAAGEPTLTITGGSLEVADWIWWGDGENSFGIWTMSGGTVDVANEFELGWGGGAGTLIMTGGTVNARKAKIPTGSGAFGELFLYGGTYNVTGDGELDVKDNGLIDITEGTLVLEGDDTAKINDLIAAGLITAYGGDGLFKLDYDVSNPGKTTVTAQQVDMEIGFATQPPVIDGEVDDIWAGASTQYIVPQGDPADASGSWKALYDSENLYVIVDINDDSLVNDTASSWQDDSVEFYFDGGNTKDGPPLSGDNRQYTFGWTTDDVQGTNTQIEGVEHAQVTTQTGWRIEIKLPWLSLQGTEPEAGDLIGIDCFYNDDDDGGDTREVQIWTFATDGSAWNDASQWGTATLTAIREPATGPIKLDVGNSHNAEELEEGFTSFTLADSGSDVDGITIEFGGINAGDARRRGEPAGVPFENIYRDFIFGRQSEPGVGYVSVTLSGLLANESYLITLYSWDVGSVEMRVADWTANDEFLFSTIHDGSVNPPAAEDDYAYTAAATADANGVILMEAVPGEGSRSGHPFAFINALEVELDPRVVFLAEDFESYADDAELTAAGWTILDTAEAIEASTWTITNPGGRGNPATLDGSASTGKFLISDSDQQSESNPVDSGASHDVSTPSFSTLGSTTVWLHVDVSAQLNNNGAAIFDVEVSTDGGGTWANVFSRVSPGRISSNSATTRLPDNTNVDGYFGRLDVDISAVAADQADVQVRFRHYEPNWDWWIAIDNVVIDNVAAPQGGTVTVFSEDFSNGLGQMNAVSGQGNTGTETWHTSDKGGRYVPGAVGEKGVNRLGPHPNEHPEFAIIDSDADPDPAEDEWLMTPSLDLSGLVEVFLHYDSETVMSSGVSNQEVLVSLDGGSTFEATPIFAYTGGGLFDNGEEPVYAARIFDVSGIAAGESQVVFAFRYTGDGDNWWWAIDNVKVTGLAPAEEDSSLVIYYSFDEVGDIVADQSGKGHDGVVVGDVTAEADGMYGGAANFATGSYLDLDGPGFPAEDIPTSAMTLAAWIKVANTGGDHEIFSARASDGSWLIHPEPKSSGDIRWLLRSYGGTTIFQIRAGTVTWDEWLHFAGTYDKETAKAALYTNGELIQEMDVASPADIAGDWDQGARVGLTIDDARPFTGLMDEFRMYTRALSHDEILAIMQGP